MGGGAGRDVWVVTDNRRPLVRTVTAKCRAPEDTDAICPRRERQTRLGSAREGSTRPA